MNYILKIFNTAAKRIILFILKAYKLMISPYLGNNCKYYPTCSVYMAQAIEKHGIIRGFIKGLYRILRCNPFSKGGYDPP